MIGGFFRGGLGIRVFRGEARMCRTSLVSGHPLHGGNRSPVLLREGMKPAWWPTQISESDLCDSKLGGKHRRTLHLWCVLFQSFFRKTDTTLVIIFEGIIARSWDRPFNMLGTSPLLGQALPHAWDMLALGTGPSTCLGQARS